MRKTSDPCHCPSRISLILAVVQHKTTAGRNASGETVMTVSELVTPNPLIITAVTFGYNFILKRVSKADWMNLFIKVFKES